MDLNDRSTLIHTLQTALNTLKQLDKQNSICHNISNRLKKAKQDYSHTGISGYGGFAIFLIFAEILFFIPPAIISLVLGVIYFLETLESVGSITMLATSLIFIILSGGGIIGIIFLFKKDKKYKLEKKQKIEQAIKKYENDLQKNVEILNKIIDSNYDVLIVIPEKYRYIHAVSAMLEYVETLRAENIKEAINLYEEEMHRMRMEMNQQQLLAIQNEQQRTLNSINSYTKANTVLSVINTVNSLTSD